MSYYVEAIWDEEAEVYHSETNVPGLVVEADTLPEFMELAASLAGDLLVLNLPELALAVGHTAHPRAKLELAIA